MPEGDTIWRTAAALRRRLAGQIVLEARPAALARLKGRQLEAVDANGKHLLMHFAGGITLHSHMRMTGAWHVYRPGERWRQPERRATAVLTFPEAVAVCFAAPLMELVVDERLAVGHLGPDILVDPFDLDEVIRRARRSEAPSIAELLLEQRVCAGVGNIYKCETLWALRLDPWTAPAKLDEPTLRRVYTTARQLMRRNLLTPIAHQRAAVHGRGGRPCPRCEMPIRVRAQGVQARLTYFCPSCQGQPARKPVPTR
ncbi:MAG: DNA glycosylase [Chloroflexi bacterium]|nr:MAG: DNA glycosylase [Chloroflexota bacterium]